MMPSPSGLQAGSTVYIITVSFISSIMPVCCRPHPIYCTPCNCASMLLGGAEAGDMH